MADDFDDDDECWNCGGEGYVYDCFTEYACINPEDGCDLCMRRCDVCRKPSITTNPDHPEQTSG